MLAEKYAQEIEGILRRFPDKKSAVLPLMHLAQQVYGYMSPDAKREVWATIHRKPSVGEA